MGCGGGLCLFFLFVLPAGFDGVGDVFEVGGGEPPADGDGDVLVGEGVELGEGVV